MEQVQISAKKSTFLKYSAREDGVHRRPYFEMENCDHKEEKEKLCTGIKWEKWKETGEYLYMKGTGKEEKGIRGGKIFKLYKWNQGCI
jgi:hypothetical protein